jgi:DNA-binding transcriptional MerR regulator
MTEYLLGAEVARRLKVSRRTVTAWVHKGILVVRRDERGWAWFPASEVQRLRRIRRSRQMSRRDVPRFPSELTEGVPAADERDARPSPKPLTPRHRRQRAPERPQHRNLG